MIILCFRLVNDDIILNDILNNTLGVDSLADDVGLLLETSGDLVPHQGDNEDNDDG